MPVDLHQRLSEFSYGYGVTREVEGLLAAVGLKSTPFLPSLRQEAKLGFDVRFDRPGAVLLLQFKLGEALKRFRREDPSKPAPLWGPHWRFRVDTAELSGQFDLLLKAERSGAEVYYVAPRFTTWDTYSSAFEQGVVLGNSVLVAPSEIDRKLASQGEPDGWHQVMYDPYAVFVCSEPVRLEEQPADALVRGIQDHIGHARSVDGILRSMYAALGERREIRRRLGAVEEEISEPELSHSPDELTEHRRRRLADLRSRSDQEADAIFAAIGVETWAAGAQLIVITPEN